MRGYVWVKAIPLFLLALIAFGAEGAQAQLSTDSAGFQDGFDGAALGPDWEVGNSNPEAFIVENGSLTIIAKAVGGLANAETPNLFRLKQALPEGDWTATLVFRGELQTGRDMLEFGLYDDPANLIVTQFWGDANQCCGSGGFYVGVLKMANGERTAFSTQVTKTNASALSSDLGQPITLKLVKSGRSYRAMTNLAGDMDEAGQPRWFETGVVTSIRPPKAFALNASQWQDTAGENLYTIESIAVEPGGS